MKNLLKLEPVRLYSVAVAVLAVVAHYNPDIPTALYLGVVAALLGVGEATRAAVTPVAKVNIPDGDDGLDHTG